jgi:YggT family protein
MRRYNSGSLPSLHLLPIENDQAGDSFDMMHVMMADADAMKTTTAPSIIDSISSSIANDNSMMLMAAETEPWVQPAILFLDPFLNLMSLAMLARVVISWYPNESNNTSSSWWIKAAMIPTEGLLQSVRGFVPPAFGVDITPVFWLAIFTFLHEILLGQQGLLIMKLKYGM